MKSCAISPKHPAQITKILNDFITNMPNKYANKKDDVLISKIDQCSIKGFASPYFQITLSVRSPDDILVRDIEEFFDAYYDVHVVVLTEF